MFDIGWSEFLVIGVVALLVIGPKELPATLRTVGHWVGKIRRMAGEFQDQFREALREAEVEELRKQFDDAGRDISKAAGGYAGFDPINTIRKELEGAARPATPAETLPATPAEVAPAALPEATASIDSAVNGEALAALAPPTEQDIRAAMDAPGGAAAQDSPAAPPPQAGTPSEPPAASVPAAQDSKPS